MTLVERSIFRAYDIRGIVDKTLTEASVFAIGQAIGSLALSRGEKKIAIARDGRLSGPTLLQALVQGLLAAGCDVISVGAVPTPVLYYAAHNLAQGSGVMLTGSHNPPDYNGLKMMIAGKTLAEMDIQLLYQKIIAKDFTHGQGSLIEVDLINNYIAAVTENIQLARPLKIVIDSGNGIAGIVAPALFRALGCEVKELFCEVDGHFPNHHPDPSQEENLIDLIAAVQESEADIGLAFDGDGDRLGVITDKGEVIWPDRQLMLFAQAVLKEHPGAEIIYDVKCSRHLDAIITEHGGRATMWKTGHSLIKAKLAQTKAKLAGEMSGHFFFNDKWFGFDDGIYSGARLLEILAKTHLTSSDVFAEIPNSVNTPELKIYVSEEEKFALMQQLVKNADFPSAKINTIDGLRVDFDDSWGVVRPSNTTPCLVLRFEADTHEGLSKVKELFRQLILSVKADLILPF